MQDKARFLEQYADYKRITGLTDLVKEHPQLRDVFETTISNAKAVVREPLNIAVMGEFSSGKSSFLNAILELGQLLPIARTPKTATVHKLVYGDKPSITIHFRNGDRHVYDGYGILQRYSRDNVNGYEDFQAEVARIRHLEVACKNELLRSFNVIDTPGFNDDPGSDKLALDALEEERVDLVLWLLRPQQAISNSELEILREIRKKVDRIYPFVNQADMETNEAAVDEQVAAHCGELFRNKERIPRVCSHPDKLGRDPHKGLLREARLYLKQHIFDVATDVAEERLNTLAGELLANANNLCSAGAGALTALAQARDVFSVRRKDELKAKGCEAFNAALLDALVKSLMRHAESSLLKALDEKKGWRPESHVVALWARRRADEILEQASEMHAQRLGELVGEHVSAVKNARSALSGSDQPLVRALHGKAVQDCVRALDEASGKLDRPFPSAAVLPIHGYSFLLLRQTLPELAKDAAERRKKRKRWLKDSYDEKGWPEELRVLVDERLDIWDLTLLYGAGFPFSQLIDRTAQRIEQAGEEISKLLQDLDRCLPQQRRSECS